MSTLIEIKLPDGYEFIRLAQTTDGWEAAVLAYTRPDKWGNPIPSQTGWAFKQRLPKRALEVAQDEARRKMANLLSLRNSRPDPRTPKLTEEEELARLMGL